MVTLGFDTVPDQKLLHKRWYIVYDNMNVWLYDLLTIGKIKFAIDVETLYKYYIPCAGDSRKYHPKECDYQPRHSGG